MKKVTALIIMVLIVLTACGSNTSIENNKTDNELPPLITTNVATETAS